MSADLHIIVFDDKKLDPEIIRKVTAFDMGAYENYSDDAFRAAYDEVDGLHDTIYASTNYEHDNFIDDVWIGQVSGMKASLTEDGYRRYIPRSVAAISALYTRHGGVVVITPTIIPAITTAFNLAHDSDYEKRDAQGFKSRGVAKARDVKRFLNANIGNTTFVDTW
jgi:hypothetical protein